MIKLSGISKKFTKKSQRRTNSYLFGYFLKLLAFKNVKDVKISVLNNIDLAISPGSRVALIGRNRSGKTTLMHLIAGILKPSAGKLQVNGRVIPLFGLGVGFSTILTGKENLILNATALGASRKWVKENMHTIQEFSGIENLDVPLKFFSNGMKTRLALSIGLFMPTDVLILDEIFDGVDLFFREKALDKIIANVTKNKTTLIVVSHDDEILRRLCTSVIYLKDGEIAAQGDLSILDAYENE